MLIADPVLLPILILLGMFTGALAALLGIGGGVVYVPLIGLLLPHLGALESGADNIRTAVATSLLIVFLASISSSLANRRASNVHYRLFRMALVFGLIGAVCGSWLALWISPNILRLLFAGLQFYVGGRMLLDLRRKEREPASECISPPRVIPISLFNGLLTSTFGIGGGVFSVPAFHQFCRVPLRVCIGTSSHLIFFNALVGLLGYMLMSMGAGSTPIRLDIGLPIAIGSMIGAPFGIRLLHMVQPGVFKRIFGLLVLASGISFVV